MSISFTFTLPIFRLTFSAKWFQAVGLGVGAESVNQTLYFFWPKTFGVRLLNQIVFCSTFYQYLFGIYNFVLHSFLLGLIKFNLCLTNSCDLFANSQV